MATTTGNDYDHITLSNGTDSTIHYLKDTVAREDLIKIQTTQPSATGNKLWINTQSSEVQVPTYDEFSDLKSAIDDLYTASDNLYNPATDRHGKTISSGVVTDNEGTKLSDYIYIGNGGKVTVPAVNGTTGTLRIFFYTDNNESALSRGLYITSTPTETFTLSSTEAYIVLLMYEQSEPYMVNLGQTLLPYTPYGAVQTGDAMDKILSPVNTSIENSIELNSIGYYTPQTENGHAYKNNVNVGDVVDIENTVAADSCKSIVIDNVVEGMKFKVIGSSTFNYLIWSWLDKDCKLISKCDSWYATGENGVVITAPENAKYLVSSGSSSYTYGFSIQYLYAGKNIYDYVIPTITTHVSAESMKSANLLKNADFTFDFFSDVHDGVLNATRVVEHAERENVDVVINAGDTVARYLNDPDNSFTWYGTLLGNSGVDVLSAVGNHDVWYGAYWTKASGVDVYNAIVQPIVSNFTGIVQPENASTLGLCYYYKDYNNVRVIVINAMSGSVSVEFWDETQSTWLSNALSDAITNSKDVMIINHSPFPKNIALRDNGSNWNSCIDYRHSALFDDIVMDTAPLTILNTFINNGGNLIGIFTGHTHVDNILTATGYDGQQMFNIASAKYNNHTDGVTYSDTNSEYYDCFNFCAVDTTNKILKIQRIGWRMDESMKVRDTISYNYSTHEILHE